MCCGPHFLLFCYVQQRANLSRTSAHARGAAVLHRRAVLAEEFIRGSPAQFQLSGTRKASSVSVDVTLGGMPATACMGARSWRAGGARACEGGIRRRGAGGVTDGVAKDVGRGSGVGKKGAEPSTFMRLWQEAKHEKGHLGMAGVCLLLSSSANLMAPTIMAK